MKRHLKTVAAIVGLIAVSACAPSPPRESATPVVESVVTSPNPVVAGGQVTATITAVDDNQIIDIVPTWADGPNGSRLFLQPGCVVGPIVPDANLRVVVNVVCDVPAIASNGDWSLPLVVVDEGSSLPYGVGYADFTVTGGSSDYESPEISYTVVPSNPAVGETFHVITTIEDETGPITTGNGFTLAGMILQSPAAGFIGCTATETVLSATSWEWDYTCIPDAPTAAAGTFSADVSFADGLNQSTTHQHTVTIG